MKKSILILLSIVLLSVGAVSAQSINPWFGFGKPIDTRLNEIVLSRFKGALKATLKDSTVKLISADIQLTAVAYTLNTHPVASTLSSTGLGISYGDYDLSTGYCNYSINADLLTKVDLSSTSTPGFGATISVGLLNKLVRVGVAYIGNTGFANGDFYVLTGVSISL